MPFKSKAQWRECYRRDDPNWDCDEFAEAYPSYASLPEYTPNGLVTLDMQGMPFEEVIEKLGLDVDSMRPASMEFLRRGGKPRKAAPIRIYFYDELGRYRLIDGRHRIAFAMESGATEIPFEYARMDEDGYLHEEGPGVLLVGDTGLVPNPEPINKKLYEKVKREIYAKYPEHSAYRSGLLVQEYKRRGGKYRGDRSKGKLRRWFKEDWRNQRGEVGYDKAGDVYRPTKRVSKKTPTTFSELTEAEVRRAQKEKKRTGRVKSFSKNGDELSYFYHVTYYNRLPSIADSGLRVGGSPSIGGAGLDSHRRGTIFLTEFEGLSFWIDRAEQWALHRSDDLLEDGYVVVVLRILDTDDLIEECEEDEVGTQDAGSYALKCRATIEPEDIQMYWGGEWFDVEDFEAINPAEAFDEEGWLVQDGPNVITY